MANTIINNTSEFSELLKRYPSKDALMAAKMEIEETVKIYRIVEDEAKFVNKVYEISSNEYSQQIEKDLHLDTIYEMQDYLRFILAEHFAQRYKNAEI